MKTWSVRTPDDELYEGTADEVVSQMANSKFHPPKSLGTYRRSVALRVKRLFGIVIDHTDSEKFLQTMIAGKMLEDLTNPS